ncbi:uncharacterized protein LOC135137332 [Zophobas morio]|uniref:uncharacterized protein LOC135137332 n=1 Tax=Zophobas morio TaxID=2755281 RepID=UPI00308284E9
MPHWMNIAVYLPFGLNVSPEVFQRVNEKVFEDLPIGIYFDDDDFIVAGENEEEYDNILNIIIKITRKYGYNKVAKDPLIQHECPEIPFEKIAANIFTNGGKDYLTLGDHYSNWIEMIPLKTKTPPKIIKKLKIIFSTQGIPVTFMSDNIHLNSREFKEFAKD